MLSLIKKMIVPGTKQNW